MEVGGLGFRKTSVGSLDPPNPNPETNTILSGRYWETDELAEKRMKDTS